MDSYSNECKQTIVLYIKMDELYEQLLNKYWLYQWKKQDDCNYTKVKTGKTQLNYILKVYILGKTMKKSKGMNNITFRRTVLRERKSGKSWGGAPKDFSVNLISWTGCWVHVYLFYYYSLNNTYVINIMYFTNRISWVTQWLLENKVKFRCRMNHD